MDQRGDTSVSTTYKQTLILVLLISGLVQGAQAADITSPSNNAVAAPSQAPVQIGWDRVGERERNWA